MKRRHRAGRRQQQRKLLRRLLTDVVNLQSIPIPEYIHTDNIIELDFYTETNDRAHEMLIQLTTTSTITNDTLLQENQTHTLQDKTNEE